MDNHSEAFNNQYTFIPESLSVTRRKGKKSDFSSKGIVLLFLIFTIYLVLPLVDIPLLGLSVSAPLFFFIAMYSIFRSPQRWSAANQKWILLAILIWSGIFISTMFNGILSGGQEFDREGFILLIQNAYWLLVFVITSYFASLKGVLEKTAKVLGWAIFTLALVRLFEAAAWGAINTYEETTRILTPNEYGFLFSTFFPLLLEPVFSKSEKRKFLMVIRMLITTFAVIINSSRSSWISVAAAIIFFTLVLVIIRPRKGWLGLLPIGLVLVSILFGLQLLPDSVNAAINQRASTFLNLEQDKSYVFRQMMVQKGLKLFKESPLIGVGASRFRKESAELELSGVFQLYSQSRFDRKSAHNSYIGFLAESGLVGSIPLGLLILLLAFKGFKAALWQTRSEELWALSILTSFLGMSIHMWTISALAGTVTWFVYGLVAALILLCNAKGSRRRFFK
jgi:O-antigen ligase